jgi:glutamate dehydrogenase/leucine dehydrogenase
VSVQGFGNVGSHVAGILHTEDGARIVAIGEWDGTIHNPQGLDVAAVLRHRQKTGSIRGFRGAKTLRQSGDCLEVDCDILVPAALENQITAQNMKKIRCRVLAEAANGPTTPAAEEYLSKKGVLVLPDIFMNAGGVTVSYFEWVQNKSSLYWSAEEVDDRLKTHMVLAARRTKLARAKYNVDMRTAAYCAALEQIRKVYDLRGVFP